MQQVNTLLSARIQQIKPSPTLAVSARAEALKAAGEPILNLSIGEPDFDTPEHIKAAAIQAIHDGHTHYTAVEGIASLRKAISDKFLRENRLNYSPNQILVSCGAKHSLYNLFISLLNAGDEVIIPAPFWVSYPDMALLAEATPVIIPTTLSAHFKMTPDQLTAAITPKTRLLILNSPSNPTGIAYTTDELKALATVLLRHPQVWIVSDDIYEHNLWQQFTFTNILNVCPELTDRCVVVNGVSKAYAMTGWRIGYAAGPAQLIAAMKKAQSQSTSNPANISQYAALAALTGDQSAVTMMTAEYQKRHEVVMEAFKKIAGIQVIPSDGTFYTFPSVAHFIHENSKINNDLALAAYLLDEAKLAIIPGSAFGTPGHIRLSFATSMDNVKEAMTRMARALNKISGS